MTTSYKKQIYLEKTSYYHRLSGCVRRVFLRGKDKFSGKKYEHRRDSVVVQLKQLTQIFAINISAYAVMHNHTHSVVMVDQQRALTWNKSSFKSSTDRICNHS